MQEQTLQQLHDERRNVWAQMNDVYAGGDGLSDEAKKSEYRRLDGIYNDLTGKIQERQQALDIQREHAARMAEMERDSRDSSQRQAPTAENAQATYDNAFWRYMARPLQSQLGQEEMRLLEVRGTSTQVGSTDSLGGYAVPQSFSNTLEIMMKYYSGIEYFGDMPTPIGGQLKYPSVDDTATVGAIIGQGVATTVSDITLGNILFGDYTIDSKIIKIAVELDNDNQVALTQSVLSEFLPSRLGRAINSYATNGTGSSQPFGLTTTATNSALTTASATAITKAELLRAWYKLDKAYMDGEKCGWMMHNTILGYLRTLDLGNTDTVQLFSPALNAGEPDLLLGKKVFINNALEAANATTGLPVTGKKHIYFGDFNKFKVRRIGGISISRNDSLYWAERAAGFMGYLRMDSNLINANAIKLITQA